METNNDVKLFNSSVTSVRGKKARGDALDIYGFGLVSPFIGKRMVDQASSDSDDDNSSANSEM